MNDYYRLYRRSNGIYYLEHAKTRKQQSLHTKNLDQAQNLLLAHNQAVAQPALNVALAKVYLSRRSPTLLTRTWADVFEEMTARYQEPTRHRFKKFCRSSPIRPLGEVRLAETESVHFLNALSHPRAGTSTNKWLRIVHNRAFDLGWLSTPVMVRKAWPALRTKRMEPIARKQHEKLIETELDPEFRHYLEMLWETGGSQTDIARLHRNNIDEINHRLVYNRKKLENGLGPSGVAIAIGRSLGRLLVKLPKEGWLFPHLAQQNEKIRASRFRKCCNRLGFTNISLHSYRYAWAQRAKTAGMPLREAMTHLGHSSRTIHQAYSEKAEVVTLPLEYYEEVRCKKEKEMRAQTQVSKE